MKKLAILSSLIISAATFAQGIKFEEGNFQSLLDKAKKENKLVFVDAYAVWCGPCKLMVKNVFPQKSVGDYYNANFVNAKIDMEKGEGIDLAKKYNVKVFPTYLFINGNGEEVHRTLGYTEEKQFIQFAMDAGDPNKRLAALKAKFEKGETNPEFLKNLAKLTIYNDSEFAGKVLERYFKEKTAFDGEDIQMLLMGAQNPESPMYTVFKERKADIIKVFPETNYNAFDKNLKVNALFKKSYNAEKKSWDDNFFLTEAQKFLSKEEAEKTLQRARMNRAARAKDFKTYEKLALEIYQDYQKLSSGELNEIAWNFFENVDSNAGLQTAVKWAQESVKKEESYANTDTLANLYNKVGDKKNAKVWAQKSVSLGKAAGEDVAETESLLKSL